jgi:tetratricopeptide (TPR) repeat protein
VAERLTPRTGEQRGADLQAAAWAALGNAKRIAEDFEGARRAFNEAWRILENGTGEPADEAHLISLEASYMKDIGEFELAESSLEEALDLYKKAQDAHQQGRILLQMGEIIGHVSPERGLAHLHKAVALFDASQEPRLAVAAQHAMAWFLNDRGQALAALAVLDGARPLYKQQSQDELIQLRLHWLEARIASRLGEYSEAETIFEQLWDEFRARDLKQEMVLVVVDLAQVLTRKGEPARAAELAAQCYSIMRSWGLHKDALAAWLVFQDALEHGKVVEDLFQRIGEYYRRHWFRPAELEVERL